MLFSVFSNNVSEQEMFSLAYEKYRAGMIRFVERYAPSISYCAEDIVQDAFIKLYKGIKHWKHLSENERKAYILVSVRNQTITMLNKLKSTEKCYENINEEETFFYRDEIELIYQNESNKCFIKEMLNILSDSLIEILILKYGCNLRNKDIASLLDITQDAVSVRDCRLKTKVSEYLTNKNKQK